MSALLAAAGLLLVAAITPGPNNLVVMRLAVHEGLVGALPAITGIVLGSVVLLALAVGGVGYALEAWPLLRPAIGLAGGAYLAGLGARLALARARERTAGPSSPAGMAGLFGFQFLNPKAWIMVLTVIAATPPRARLPTFLLLAPLFALIPACCLALWACLGAALSPMLARPAAARWTDRVLGTLLIVCAAAVITDAVLSIPLPESIR